MPSPTDYTAKTPLRCPYCDGTKVTKKGVRKKKLESVQLWRCGACKRVFTPGPTELSAKTYPLRVVLDAITNYSLGASFEETAHHLRRRWRCNVAPSTVGNWITQYKDIATYHRLRDTGRTLFKPRHAIRSLKLYHRQVYSYAYHRPKVALLTDDAQHRRFAGLCHFLTETVFHDCPHSLFRDDAGARASKLAADFVDRDKLIVTKKQNAATRAAALVLPTVGNNYLRHERLQQFMLANDSVTIAVEVPIWLSENDISALEHQHGINLVPGNEDGTPRAATGHIDFLQIRNGAVHVLDYKPDARTNKPFAQLTLYALALTHLVPGLKLFDIKCAWFNEHEYCEFFPRTILRKLP